MAIYQIHEELELAASPDEAWDFLSSPSNLKEITPDYMGFEIHTPGLPDKIYPGLMISYKIRPFAGIAMDWLTEITQVREPFYFVDEQRAGPYALWHHEHSLRPTDQGTLMTDLLTYRLPLGPLGDLAHRVFVRKQLEGIFRYREQALEKIFGRP
ncbi:MAG: SRPBCC family protein [Bacteroidales bacterium]|nr:SRPBCC family protein [Bacteroidales bacterium]